MEEIGIWRRLEREQRVCPQCAENEIKTAEQMFFYWVESSWLDFTITYLDDFLQHPPNLLGSFANRGWHRHRTQSAARAVLLFCHEKPFSFVPTILW